MSKPKIYGYCDAGCKWETVHKSDFDKIIPYVEIEQVNSVAYLEVGKTYKIVSNSTTSYGFSIQYHYHINSQYEGITADIITCILPTFDKYKPYVYIKVLDVDVKTVASNFNKTTLTIVYEVNDKRYTETYTTSDSTVGIDLLDNPLRVYNASQVLLCNEGGEVTLAAEKVFIKYADDENGTNMTSTYSGQEYIGVYTGLNDTLDANLYNWLKVKGEVGGLNNISQYLGNSKNLVISQKTVTEEFKKFDNIITQQSTGEYTEVDITSLSINDFSLRTGTVKGETGKFEVNSSGEYILSFDNCPYDGVNEGYGAASLYLTEYDEDGTVLTTDTVISFNCVNNEGYTKTHSLYSTYFPNGGYVNFTVSENTRYISIMFDAYKGAPERLPEGLILKYNKPEVNIVLNENALPENFAKNELEKEIEVVSNNLFDKNTAVIQGYTYLGKDANGVKMYGMYLTGAGTAATEVSDSGFDTTSMAIEVEGGGTYHKSCTSIVNCFDENDIMISNWFSFDACSITLPYNTKYIRITLLSENVEHFQFNKGNQILPYDEFKKGFKDYSIENYSQVMELLNRNALGSAELPIYMRQIAEESLKYVAPDRHTFLFIADTHAQQLSDRSMSLAASMTKYVPCSYMVHGGDITDGVTDKSNELMLLSSLVRNGNEAKCPTYYVKGNHDWNLLYVNKNEASSDQYILNSEIASRTNCFVKNNVQGNVSKMYFYVDDETTKIRSIFLNSFEKDESDDKTTLSNNDRVYGQEQLTWLVNEALDFSDKEDKTEWGVIAFSHIIPQSYIWHIFSNFKMGTNKELSITEENKTFVINAEFSSQGAMEMISIFVGDIHFDGIQKLNSASPYPVVFILNASLANDYANVDSMPSGYASVLKPPTKHFGTENETAFDLVTIDRTNKLIYLTRFGARSYSYNDETGVYDKVAARTRVIDYTTATHVVETED